jgi:hypothetical protein
MSPTWLRPLPLNYYIIVMFGKRTFSPAAAANGRSWRRRSHFRCAAIRSAAVLRTECERGSHPPGMTAPGVCSKTMGWIYVRPSVAWLAQFI